MAQSQIGQIVFFLRFQQPFAFDVIARDLVNQESILQRMQIVIDGLGTETPALVF